MDNNAKNEKKPSQHKKTIVNNMGQCIVTPAPPEVQTPDENGLYPPLEEWRKWAKLTLGANVHYHVCQMFNQEAISNKLAGQPIDALPYPPLEEWRKWAKPTLTANVSIHVCRSFNQEAIFNKIAGQPIDALPYPPLEEWRAEVGEADAQGQRVDARVSCVQPGGDLQQACGSADRRPPVPAA